MYALVKKPNQFSLTNPFLLRLLLYIVVLSTISYFVLMSPLAPWIQQLTFTLVLFSFVTIEYLCARPNNKTTQPLLRSRWIPYPNSILLRYILVAVCCLTACYFTAISALLVWQKYCVMLLLSILSLLTCRWIKSTILSLNQLDKIRSYRVSTEVIPADYKKRIETIEHYLKNSIPKYDHANDKYRAKQDCFDALRKLASNSQAPLEIRVQSLIKLAEYYFSDRTYTCDALVSIHFLNEARSLTAEMDNKQREQHRPQVLDLYYKIADAYVLSLEKIAVDNTHPDQLDCCYRLGRFYRYHSFAAHSPDMQALARLYFQKAANWNHGTREDLGPHPNAVHEIICEHGPQVIQNCVDRGSTLARLDTLIAQSDFVLSNTNADLQQNEGSENIGYIEPGVVSVSNGEGLDPMQPKSAIKVYVNACLRSGKKFEDAIDRCRTEIKGGNPFAKSVGKDLCQVKLASPEGLALSPDDLSLDGCSISSQTPVNNRVAKMLDRATLEFPISPERTPYSPQKVR